MKQIVTVTVAIFMFLLVVACGGCGKETSLEKQLENVTLIKKGNSEWDVWWKLGAPHKKGVSGGRYMSDEYVYGDTTIEISYFFVSDGAYRVTSVIVHTPEGANRIVK